MARAAQPRTRASKARPAPKARSKAKPKGQSKTAPGRYVFGFGGGKADGSADMKNLLGGKGANLAEMTHIGLPVPAGFTITTEVCTYYYAHDRTLSARAEEPGRRGPREDREEVMGSQVRRPERIRCSSPAAPAPASPCRA